MITCKNCGTQFAGNYCPNCAQSAGVSRIKFRSFFSEFMHSIFQLDRGFFYTLQQLVIRPAQVILEFLEGKRRSYFKPITYVFLLSTIYFLTSRLINHNIWINDFIEGFLLYDDGSKEDLPLLVDWFVNNFSYANLLLLPVFSLASFISFTGHHRNFAEHVVVNAFITGQQVIFYLVFSLLSLTSESDFFEFMPVILSITYAFWVYWRVFSEGKRIWNLLRTVSTYLLYLIFCTILLGIFIPQ
jgi:hypothetical protein